MYTARAPARLNRLVAFEKEYSHFVQRESRFATANDDLVHIGSARIDFRVTAPERKLELRLRIALVDVCDLECCDVVSEFVQHWPIGYPANGNDFGDEDVGRVVKDLIQRVQPARAGPGRAGNGYPHCE